MTDRTMTIPLELDVLRRWYTFQVDRTVMPEMVELIRRGAAMADDPFKVKFTVEQSVSEPIFEEDDD